MKEREVKLVHTKHTHTHTHTQVHTHPTTTGTVTHAAKVILSKLSLSAAALLTSAIRLLISWSYTTSPVGMGDTRVNVPRHLPMLANVPLQTGHWQRGALVKWYDDTSTYYYKVLCKSMLYCLTHVWDILSS